MLWISGSIYSYFENKMDFGKFHSHLIIIMSGSIGLWSLSVFFNLSNWMYYVMFAWFNVLYILNNLHFWGIAATIFDVRQSKRLFGVISAGDIPAKFLGYAGASLLYTFLEPDYTIIISAVVILISLYTWKKISNSKHIHVSHHHEVAHEHDNALLRVFDFMLKNKLVLHLAIMSLIVYSTITIVNFAFYAEVKNRYISDQQLAGFLGIFMASSRGIALILKVIFTSRIINNLGIKKSLIIPPVILFVIAAMVLMFHFLHETEFFLLAIFGIMAISADVLRSSLQTPVFISMMQPIPTHDRMRAHNIVKGIMDPFAFMLSGLLLLFVIRIKGEADLVWITSLILIFVVAWIIWVFIVHRQYLATIVKTLGSRFFSENELAIYDQATTDLFEKKLQTADSREALVIIRMLYSIKAPNLPKIILQQLKSTDRSIVIECIKISGLEKINEAGPSLIEIAQTHEDTDIKSFALKTYCLIEPDENSILSFIEYPQIKVSRAAVVGLLLTGSESSKEIAMHKLNNWRNSTDPHERLHAVKALRNFKTDALNQLLIEMMNDEDKRVSQTAIKAAGQIKNEMVLTAAMNYISTDRNAVMHSLIEAGPVALPIIEKAILSEKYPDITNKKLIEILGRNHIHQTNDTLLRILKSQHKYASELIDALYMNHYNAVASEQHFEKLIKKYLQHSVDILFTIHYLKKDAPHFRLLHQALSDELIHQRTLLLKLFSFIYDRAKIHRAIIGFNSQKKDSTANAMELIEIILNKPTAEVFIPVFENVATEHKIPKLKSMHAHINFNLHSILISIISDKADIFSDWTKSVALYEGKQNKVVFEKEMLKGFLNSESQLLRETAAFAA